MRRAKTWRRPRKWMPAKQLWKRRRASWQPPKRNWLTIRRLFDYSKITAPFSGVVTERYANLGTLVQAGTSSSTQAMPIVRLSQDDLFRLVIPVPESYVRYIRVGDPVNVHVPSLNRTLSRQSCAVLGRCAGKTLAPCTPKWTFRILSGC